ncbi:MAG TPA: hypothetical protein VGM03_00770 [Phycisphaerae bacterium]|jgi:hypothetical protein
MKSHRLQVLAAALACCLPACLNVKAPERIEVNAGAPPQDIDTSHVPHPATLGESHAEIDRAYRQIAFLEDRLARAERKRDDYKRERDECEKKYKKLKKD